MPLSPPSRACTRRKPEDRTLHRCTGALAENIGTGRDGRGKSRLRQMREIAENGQNRGILDAAARKRRESGEKAGQSRGVVRIPRRSHLPAVRAVSGICEGVVERAKIALVGSQFEKSPPFQGTRRGCTKKVHGKRKKQQVQRWVKQLRVYREKQRAGPKTCTLPSEKSMLYCTRDPARIRLTIICQKSCSSALQYRLSGIS